MHSFSSSAKFIKLSSLVTAQQSLLIFLKITRSAKVHKKSSCPFQAGSFWSKFFSKIVFNQLYPIIQVNLYQKLLFLHQLSHNMTTDCPLNYKFNAWKFLAQNMGRTCCVQKLFLTFRTISVHNMFSHCSAKILASDKDLAAYLLNKN